MQALLSGVQGIPKLLRGVTCVVMVTVSRLIQFGLQGRDLEPVRELLLLQSLLILTEMSTCMRKRMLGGTFVLRVISSLYAGQY